MKNSNYFVCLGEVRSVRRIRRGVELDAGSERVKVEFLFPDVARVKVSQAGVYDATPTFAVAQDEFGSPALEVKVSKTAVTVSSEAMRLVIDRSEFSYRAERLDGSMVMESVPEWGYRSFNDAWLVRRRATKKDRFYGLGEKTGGLDHRGKRLQMWNTDILAPDTEGRPVSSQSADPADNPTSTVFDPYYVSIPLLYHVPADDPSRCGASFFDNGYRMEFDLSEADHYQVGAMGGQLTEYLFAGPTLPGILKRYTQLTGRMTAPPLWALGHHQCRWFDYTEAEWLELAATYRAKRIPCDVLWLDIGYMDGYRVFTWDDKRHPDVPGSLAKLQKQGFRAITIIDPGVKVEEGYPVFDEGMERNLFCKTDGGTVYVGQVWPGKTAFPDFVKEETRRWWGRLNAEHVQSGLAGIWNDMNEPATGVVPPGAMRFDRDGADYPHDRYHNQYAMLMAMGTRDGLRAAMPELRTFILSRAGFAGIQRFAANWTGDNCSKWEHLAMSVYMNANLGISGQPFVGSDIGGFCGDTSEELLVRWYQYGVFQPFMRNHACKGTIDQYPWSFGKAAEAAIKKAVELRYQLLPYVYSTFMAASESGEPVQRPLVYDYPEEKATWQNGSEYLFGRDLLVAPVVEPEARKRQLYLPTGEWYPLGGGKSRRGGRKVTVEAPLDEIPVFVRAGAVIPSWQEPPVSTMDGAPREVALHVYVPGTDGTTVSMLHEDDGLTDRHESGEFVRSALTVTRKGRKLTVRGEVSGDGYPGHARERLRVIWHGISRDDDVLANRQEGFELSVKLG